MTQATEGPRARYRQQVRDEVQALAWEQINDAGASAVSLKAIATQMGMTAPALYRYYGSRDELLSQLILRTYRDLAELVEAADKADSAIRITAIARAMRTWAVAHPHRYLLLYGTPVPGYHAPAEATTLAQRVFAPILAGFAELLGDASNSRAQGARPIGDLLDPAARHPQPAVGRSLRRDGRRPGPVVRERDSRPAGLRGVRLPRAEPGVGLPDRCGQFGATVAFPLDDDEPAGRPPLV